MKLTAVSCALLTVMLGFGGLTGGRAQTGNARPAKLNVAILIFDGVQIIDYTGPYEVLGQWRRRNVYTVAEKSGTVTTNMGMLVIPNYTFDNQPRPDIIVIPGGGASAPGPQARGVGAQLDNQRVLRWIRESARNAKYVLSVCNGAFLLAKAGLLDGLEATTTAGLIPALRAASPKTRVVSDRRFTDNGKVITTAGLSSGMDGALHLISRLDGMGWAHVIAANIEYDWRPDSGYARAALADKLLPEGIYEPFSADAEPADFSGSLTAAEVKWVARSPSTPAEMLRRINQRWAAERNWRKADDSSRAGGEDSPATRWALTDEKGQLWQAGASVEPAARAGRLLVTLRIWRVGATPRP